MPISQAEMNADQMRAVAEALAEYLKLPIAYHGPFGDDPPDPELVPIVPGAVRRSRSDAAWAIFGDPDKVDGRWYRVIDIQPHGGYSGGHVVTAPDGDRPIGHPTLGPLVLHRIRSRLLAQPINTGWNLRSEIQWQDEAS